MKIKKRFLLLVCVCLCVFLLASAFDVFAAPCGVWPCNCGDTLTASVTMDSDLDCSATALTIGAGSITLDCDDHEIKYDTAAGSTQYAVNNTGGYDDIIIRNCNIQQGGAGSESYAIILTNSDGSEIYSNNINLSHRFGIYLTSSPNSKIYNNNINISENDAYVISLTSSSNYGNVSRNNVTITGNYGHGIFLSGSAYSNVSFNNVANNGLAGLKSGIYLTSTANYNNIYSNTVTALGINTHCIYLVSSPRFNNIYSNNITSSGTNNWGIFVSTSSANNTLLNNNIDTFAAEIFDDSGTGSINYLIYNNSYGEIRWINDSKGFLDDLDLDIEGGIGLGINLFIGDNAAALNTTALNADFSINSSANITLRGLALPYVSDIIRMEEYSTSSSDINSFGTGCNGTSCLILDYDNTTGVLFFNTTSFSSFAADNGLSGSMTIYGPNGTFITGTRNVYLNLSYDSLFGIDKCRVANDAAENLDNWPWESCSKVEAWILSAGFGNKTVYFQIRDVLGNNITFSDSILHLSIQDYTSPTPPVVYDSEYGYDIDWWNSNTTLGAYWWNSTEDISSIYYFYRVLEDGACYNGDCSWTGVGSSDYVVLSGIALSEGSNYSFEVIAYSGLNSSVGASNGSVVDLTDPGMPSVNSTTHPMQNISYDSSTALFGFNSSDPLGGGVASGIASYSYILDSHPGTAPDTNTEQRLWEALALSYNNAHETVLRSDSSISSPNTYAVFSQIDADMAENDSVRVRVAVAEDSFDSSDFMNLEVFMISIPDGNDVVQFDNKASAISNIALLNTDVMYSENLRLARIYSFDLQINTTSADDLNDNYVVVSGVLSDDDNVNNISIAGSSARFDNSTRNFLCDDADSCSENTSVLDYAIEVKRQDSGDVWDVRYDDLSDGTHYFHVKAKDNAGNWGDTYHYRFIVDTEGVSVKIASPFSGQLFSSADIDVSAEVDDSANVTVVALHPDGSNDTDDWVIVNTTYMFNLTLENGTNELYAVAVAPDSGVVTYSSSVFVRLGTGQPESNKTLRVSYTGAGALASHIRGVNEGSAVVGIATENDAADFTPASILSDTGLYTIKLFISDADMDASDIEEALDDDDFLDRRIPFFSYEKGVPYYIIRSELRPPNIYIEGDRTLDPGNYLLIFTNRGETPDGKVNVSVRIV